jgi:hypothetical protein
LPRITTRRFNCLAGYVRREFFSKLLDPGLTRTIGCFPFPGSPCIDKTLGSAPTGASLRPAVEATGGEAVPGDMASERLPELIRRIRQRYLLGFYAEPTSERDFREIEVRLTPDARKRYPGALLRTRRGYYTSPARSSQSVATPTP